MEGGFLFRNSLPSTYMYTTGNRQNLCPGIDSTGQHEGVNTRDQKYTYERAACTYESTAWTLGQHGYANTPGQGWGVHKLLTHVDTGFPEVAQAQRSD
jgi:hypothetical protein